MKKQIVCTTVPKEWIEELDALARQEDTTLAEVLRELIDRGLHGQRTQVQPVSQQGGAGMAQSAEEQTTRNSNLSFYIGISLTPGLYQTLTEMAESLGVARTDLIRRAIAAGLEYVKSTGRLPPCPYELSGEHKVAFTVYLAASLLREMDDILNRLGKGNRSYFIRRSFCYYITSVMKQGSG